MPLNTGLKLPLQLFEIKKIIHGRLPDEITLQKHNDQPCFLNMYLRHIKALKDYKYPLNSTSKYQKDVIKLTEIFSVEQMKIAKTVIELINGKTWT